MTQNFLDIRDERGQTDLIFRSCNVVAMKFAV